MLRIGLTGDLGSGKSTVAAMLAARGALVFSSDDMARAMMQPGQHVYEQIAQHFGPSILTPDTKIDRRKLAALAFDPIHPRIAELNTIVHPAVLAAQAEQLAALDHTNPHAIAVVESALIFSTPANGSNQANRSAQANSSPRGKWSTRFERILLVTAPDHEKIARFLGRMAAGRQLSSEERTALEADARRRLALQHSASYAADCIVLHNDGTLEQLEHQVEAAWRDLQNLEKRPR